tara:strand:- start:6835 stop:7212 length:378 start_codon:yes stop_codon:yes gene_type:complete
MSLDNFKYLIFESLTKYIIVEIDRYQKSSNLSKEECSKMKKFIDKINNNKSIIFIKYNPGNIQHKKKILYINNYKRICLLINFIIDELKVTADRYTIRLVQLYFDSNKKIYNSISDNDITIIAAM